MSRDNEEKRGTVIYDVIGYATLMSGDMFGDGFYSDIPYLVHAMIIIDPDNFSHKNPDIVLDVMSRKCKSSEISEECSICLDKINEGDNVCTIHCEHTFHFKCLTEWGKYKRECPLCRSEIPVLNN
jgi:hypothetical protein